MLGSIFCKSAHINENLPTLAIFKYMLHYILKSYAILFWKPACWEAKHCLKNANNVQPI